MLEAANGNDALKAIDGYSDGKVDLLITDVVMPLMGAGSWPTDYQRSIRRPRYCSRQVTRETNLAMCECAMKARISCRKPYTMNSLVSKVRLLLGGWIEYRVSVGLRQVSHVPG